MLRRRLDRLVSVDRVWAAAFLLAGCGAILAHASLYRSYLADGGFISMRYAARLLAGHGLTWTDGPPVEGYSNLLWILLVAALGRLGLDLVDAARLVGLGAWVLALLALLRAQPPDTTGRRFGLLLGVPFLLGAAPLAVWSMGALEGPLAAALLAWATVLTIPALEALEGKGARALLLPSLLLGLLCLTRPDGPIFVASSALALILTQGLRRPAVGALLVLTAAPAAAVLGQLAFRVAYYGEWVPNSALVKLRPSHLTARIGVQYLQEALLALAPPSLLALLASPWELFRRTRRPAALLLSLHVLAWGGYLVAVGGGFLPGFRHLVPVLPLLALLLARGGESWWAAARAPWQRVLLVVLALLACGLFVQAQLTHPHYAKARTDRSAEQGRALGQMLARGFASARPLVAGSTAGSVPYWSGLPGLDLTALNDPEIARDPASEVLGRLPWRLFSNPNSVLRRRPDLVLFGMAAVKGGAAEQKLLKHPDFLPSYTRGGFEAREPTPVRGVIWVRRDSPKTGISRRDERVSVPAYLLADGRHQFAHLDEQDRFVLDLEAGGFAALERVDLEAGTWRVSTLPASGARLWLEGAAPGSEDARDLGRLPARLALAEAGPVSLRLETDRALRLHSLELARPAPGPAQGGPGPGSTRSP